jgi:hypothetical protein
MQKYSPLGPGAYPSGHAKLLTLSLYHGFQTNPKCACKIARPLTTANHQQRGTKRECKSTRFLGLRHLQVVIDGLGPHKKGWFRVPCETPFRGNTTHITPSKRRASKNDASSHPTCSTLFLHPGLWREYLCIPFFHSNAFHSDGF